MGGSLSSYIPVPQRCWMRFARLRKGQQHVQRQALIDVVLNCWVAETKEAVPRIEDLDDLKLASERVSRSIL